MGEYEWFHSPSGLACILAILEKERAADLLHGVMPIVGPSAGWHTLDLVLRLKA
jgi:hypothetical protein